MNIFAYYTALLWLHFEASTARTDEYLAIQRQDFAEARYWRQKARQCAIDIDGLRFQRWLKSSTL